MHVNIESTTYWRINAIRSCLWTRNIIIIIIIIITIIINIIIVKVLGVLGRFLAHLMTSSVGTSGNGPKTTRNRNLHPSMISAGNMSSIRRQMRSQGPLLFCEVPKNSLIGNWAEVVILAVMDQYRFSILFFWAPFWGFFIDADVVFCF